MDVRLPDGRIVTGVPDTMTQGELKTILQKNLMWVDPTDEMSGPARVAAGVGQGTASLLRGIGQRAGMVSESDVAESRRTDAPLLRTTGGAVGSFAGQVAPALALSTILGVNTAVGSTLLGAGLGAAQPTVAGESVTSNMTTGALLGAGGHGLGRLVGGPVTNRNPQPKQALVDLAQQKYGMQLPASARTGSPALGYMESQVATMPGGGRMGEALRTPNEQWTRAVMREAGVDDLATSAAMGTARAGTQARYADIWSRNLVRADDTLVDNLADAVNKAHRMLTPEKARIVERQVDNILAKVRPDGTIDGSIYQAALRPELRSVTKSDSSLMEPLRDVMKALNAAADRSISPADAAALRGANRQYATQKALDPHIPRAESRGGTFAPTSVMTATKGWDGDIAELGKIGAGLLREPPQSGTVPRQLYASLLMGAPAAGVGYHEGGWEGAGAGLAAGLLAPFAASQVLSRPGVQNYLTRGLLSLSPQEQAALNAASRSGLLALPGALSEPR